MDVDQAEDLPDAVGKNDDAGDSIDANMFMGVSNGVLEEREKLARLGFMRINVMSPPTGTQWGQFNDRVYRPDWIKSLVEQYSYQLKNCTDSTAMTGAVRRSWVKNLDEAVDSVHNGGHIDKIPLLELTAEGVKAAKAEGLWMFSGNHRRHALEIFLDGEREKLAVLDAKVAKLHEKQLAAGASYVVDVREQAYATEAKKLRAAIEKNSHWAVRIYDRGELQSGVEGLVPGVANGGMQTSWRRKTKTRRRRCSSSCRRTSLLGSTSRRTRRNSSSS